MPRLIVPAAPVMEAMATSFDHLLDFSKYVPDPLTVQFDTLNKLTCARKRQICISRLKYAGLLFCKIPV
jgi:hypothetical protein